YTQADARFFLDDDEELLTDQLLLRRVRLNLEGTVFKYFDFRVSPDFAGASFTLQDAYADVNFFPQAKAPDRQVQAAGRARAAAVRGRAGVRGARAAERPGAEPRQRRAALR
ncbi:MAG: hypothetical protein ACREQ9_25300, partial [Candidatus Binatia bacterium]